MSPRAACRLATLGFRDVYDYVPGKADWLARGLPIEGELAHVPTAGRLARDDVVTCHLADRVAEVRGRVDRSTYGFALVVSDGGVLLGRLRASAMRDADDAATAEALMEPGPSTVRPDLAAADLAQRDLHTAVVSTPEGRLMGVVRRQDLDAAMTESEAR